MEGRKLSALGRQYSADMKIILRTCTESLNDFDACMESTCLLPLVVFQAHNVILSGDMSAILEGLDHGGVGKYVEKNDELPTRMNLNFLPSYRRWNKLAPSKKVSSLILGTSFFAN